MGYAAYMRTLLEPLRLYQLEEGLSGAELDTIGAALDSLAETLLDIEEEGILSTAQGDGLSRWEALFPYRPMAETPAARRAALAALLRIDGGSFTLAAMSDTLQGCGLPAAVEETGEAFTVAVSFPGYRGVPENMEALQERIEAILPCHLAVTYVYRFLTWAELESCFATWQALESAALTWDALERYDPAK